VLPPPDDAEIGITYCRDVVEGRIDACRWIKLACKRHLDDLARWDGKAGAPFSFDRKAGNRVARFVRTLPHTKGPLTGQKIALEPWQSWILTCVFGWVVNQPGDQRHGKRRFRRVYLEMPRGQGKSALSSAVALAMLAIDGEGGAECYSLGTTRDQARIVARDAQQMARKSPDLMRALGVEVNAHNIIVPKTASRFEALTSESHTLDGLAIHFACLDEAHAYRDRNLYDVAETATAKRLQSLLWVITTVGFDRAGICYELRTFATKVLEGLVADEAQFAAIYTLDEGDDWTAESSWRKANPNWGISVMPDIVAGLGAKAMQLPAAQANFRTKHLCEWVSSDASWLPAEAWAKCADPGLKIEDFHGEAVEIGLDLATRTDIASKVIMARRLIDGVSHYYVWARNYLPEAAISDSRNASYKGWEITGHLVATPGDVTDFSLIEAEILYDASRFRVRSVAYDPWQATDMAQRLQGAGANVVEFRNTVANFSAPMKELAALVLQGRLHHDGDPVFAWAVSNVVCHFDAKDNVYPRKERNENKIDPVVAAIMAMGRWLADPGEGRPSEYGDLIVL
jgi:phage terminase large subunit-like protein